MTNKDLEKVSTVQAATTDRRYKLVHCYKCGLEMPQNEAVGINFRVLWFDVWREPCLELVR
jgi:hypothetical protein